MASSRSRAICISGSGRSGTSLTARVLNLLGVYLGSPDGLLSRGKYNRTGYFEHLGIKKINEAIIQRLTGDSIADATSKPVDFPEGWVSSEELTDLRQQARLIISEEFQGKTLWGGGTR